MASTTDNAVNLTVDIVLLAAVDGVRHVLLIRRGDDSDAYPGCWALPGGYVDAGERIEDAARRELAEETALGAPDSWQRLGVYDDPGRDPRGRVVSIAHVAVLPDMPVPTSGDDARDAQWIPVDQALAGDLAFDHRQILRDAIRLA